MGKPTAVFVDGFNLYHGLCDSRRNELKWLSLSRLAARLVPKRTHSIDAIYYFSAIAEHLPDRAARHRIYLAALRAEGVTPIMGEFKDKDKPFRCCYGCRHIEKGKEEKRTDVNIALHLVSKAYRREFETAVLITADSDLVPVVEFIKTEFPTLELILAMPPYRGSDTLRKMANRRRKIKIGMVQDCLLPAVIYDQSGGIVTQRPSEI